MEKFQVFLLVAPVLLFSMVAHEYAHGYAAFTQGDPTAYQLGRLTWNPLKHIDPMMTIVMPIVTYFFAHFFFGGAKPVPVNPRNYRKYKQGDIIVSLAGIFANFCLAIICTVMIVVLGWAGRASASVEATAAILQAMMFVGVMFNLVLAFFNLLPIPPLDGSHVFKYLLPPAWSLQYQRVGFYGIFILVLLLRFLQPLYFGPADYLMGHAMHVAGSAFLPQALDMLQGAGFLGA